MEEPRRNTTGILKITLKNQVGKVLPGSRIYLRNMKTGITLNGVTDTRGFWEKKFLGPGKYGLKITVKGLDVVRKMIEIQGGEVTDENLNINPEEVG